MMTSRTFDEIKEKLRTGNAVVMTAEELKKISLREVSEVDVVTAGTRGLMSGTYAVLTIPVKKSKFSRAEKLTLNGITAHVGPCPNENLNLIEAMVFGTSSDGNYGAGHLFRDMLDGEAICVQGTAKGNIPILEDVFLEDMPYAKLMATRNAFRNYSAMTNPHNSVTNTIFHARAFLPNCMEATVSGCGSINPIQNDPLLKVIGIGTKALINGSEGFVMGTGTRATAAFPNLTMCADMKNMDPEYAGGFLTSEGPECIVSWALPIPILDNEMLLAAQIQDREVTLPVSDVTTRTPIAYADYGQVWENTSLSVEVYSDSCKSCPKCQAADSCPMNAIKDAKINRHKCFNCGLCSTICPDVFHANLGELNIQIGSDFKRIPISCRQSDRLRAIKLAEELKERLLDSSFTITEPVAKLFS